MTSYYAVVGASRGIGLEYVRQLAGRPNTTVFAVVRNARTSTHLQSIAMDLKSIHVVEADVADYNSLERAAKQVSEITGGKLDCLIHNAAWMDSNTVFKGYDDYANMDELDAEFIKAYQINALGVVHSIAAFLPLLRASSASFKKIVAISTGEANPMVTIKSGIADTTGYAMSKAAALMATTKWAVKLKDEGFIVVSITPGMVDTSGTVGESGDPEVHATFLSTRDRYASSGLPVVLQTPEQSVSAQLKVIDELKPSDNGLLLAHTGGVRG
ncbi:NAD-P-binding protein [Fomes fomentarius]|nr:NAD-P-binding protein [Fomes fomentarius]